MFHLLGLLLFGAGALASVIGFLASFEPGVGWQWKAFYAVLFCVCVALAVLSARVRKPERD